MEAIGGLIPTGRKLLGPASDLIELDSESGLRHTAIVFHPQYRSHHAINDALDVVEGYLESPMVTGMVELVGHDREKGAFIYPTGQCWSVAEVIRSLSDLGEAAGVRAGLELMYAAGQILVEAADVGEAEGVYSHGGLTPWRVTLKRDGQVQIIGYALPQVEILLFHEDPHQVPSEDSFRYCPPERIEAHPENLSSDLFGLSLIAFELMTGKPVYDGLVNDIRQQAARGEGTRRLFRFRDVLPKAVRDVLADALRPEMEDRYPDGPAFLEAVRRVLVSPDATGPSLLDLMEKVSRQQRTGQALEEGKTMMLSKEQLAELRMGETAQEDRGGAEGRSAAKVWSPPPSRRARRTREAPVEEAEKATPPEPAGSTDADSPLAEEDSADEGRKWASGRRGVRRMPRRAREGSTPNPAEESAEEPVSQNPPPSVPPPPESTSSSGRTADLLARIRSSSDRQKQTSENGSREESRRQAASVIQAILSSSGRSRDLEERLRRAREEVERTSASTSEADRAGEQRFHKGRRRAPRRVRHDPDALPVAECKSAQASVQGGAPPDTDSARSELESARDGKTAVMPEVGSPEPQPPAPEPASSTPAKRPLQVAASLDRPPDPVPSSGAGGTEKFLIQLGSGAKALRVRLPANVPSSEAIAWLVGNVLPVRTDLSGRITGWYRFAVSEGDVPGDRPMSELDPATPLVLRVVSNRTVQADIRVEGEIESRFLAPMGTAVPAVTLVEHLVAWLGLPGGEWHLSVDGRVLSAHAILADHIDEGTQRVAVVMSRTSPEKKGR